MVDVEYTSIGKIGAENFGKTVTIRGVIVSASKVKNIVTVACFICENCGLPTIIEQTEEKLQTPQYCNRKGCRKSRRFKFSAKDSEFDDFQELVVQELQADMAIGGIPRSVPVWVIGEQTGLFKAGDEVVVVGTVRHKNAGKEAIIFTPYIRAEQIIKLNKTATDIEISPEDEEKIRELAKNPQLYKTFINSIAPHLCGIEKQKEAILYALFGGVKVDRRTHRKRGDINLLFVGDPSVGKSELLMSVARIAPRAVYTSGRGSSAAGLTVAVVREKDNWVLHAGALVLGDKGVVCIDEIDKMRPEDRDSIHVALEQQKIPCNKAGINTVLDARCTVIAVCNPTYTYYDDNRSVAENIKGKLDPALLTRFDLIFVLRDIPEDVKDDKVFKTILGLNEEQESLEILDEEFMRKYIAYAKRINPKMSVDAKRLLDNFAQEMRRRSGCNEQTAVIFTYRTLQALMRLSEAHARVRLSETVDGEDAKAAIEIMKASLYDVGLVEATLRDVSVKTLKEKRNLVFNTICDLARNKENGVDEMSIIQTCAKRANLPIDETQRILYILEEKERKIYQPTPRFYKPIYDIDSLFG